MSTFPISAIALLGAIYFFYTIPLTAASRLVSPQQLDQLFPKLGDTSDLVGFQLANLMSGLATAVIWSSFFAICPVMFKVGIP